MNEFASLLVYIKAVLRVLRDGESPTGNLVQKHTLPKGSWPSCTFIKSICKFYTKKLIRKINLGNCY